MDAFNLNGEHPQQNAPESQNPGPGVSPAPATVPTVSLASAATPVSPAAPAPQPMPAPAVVQQTAPVSFFKTKKGKTLLTLIAFAIVGAVIYMTTSGGGLFKGNYLETTNIETENCANGNPQGLNAPCLKAEKLPDGKIKFSWLYDSSNAYANGYWLYSSNNKGEIEGIEEMQENTFLAGSLNKEDNFIFKTSDKNIKEFVVDKAKLYTLVIARVDTDTKIFSKSNVITITKTQTAGGTSESPATDDSTIVSCPVTQEAPCLKAETRDNGVKLSWKIKSESEYKQYILYRFSDESDASEYKLLEPETTNTFDQFLKKNKEYMIYVSDPYNLEKVEYLDQGTAEKPLVPKKKYWYGLAVKVDSDKIWPSDIVEVTAPAAAATDSDPLSEEMVNIQLSATKKTGKITLIWQEEQSATPEQFSGYVIYRGEAAGNITEKISKDTPISGNSFDDTDVKKDIKYYYIVKKIGQGDEVLGASNVASEEAAFYETNPLELSFNLNEKGEVKLTWQDSNMYPGEDASQIKYQIIRDNVAIGDPLQKSTAEYTDTLPAAEKNKIHTYQIKTVGLSQEGNVVESNIVTVDPILGTANQKPNKPSLNLPLDKATAVSLQPELRWLTASDPDNQPNTIRNYRWYVKDVKTEVKVWNRNWNNADGGAADCSPLTATGSSPQEKPQVGTWTCLMAQVPAGKLQENTKYAWAVEAGDGELPSGYSDEWTFTTGSPDGMSYGIVPPTDLKAVKSVKNGLDISWKKPADAIPLSYKLYRHDGEVAKPAKEDLTVVKGWKVVKGDIPDKEESYFDESTTTIGPKLDSPSTYVITSLKLTAESDPSEIAVYKPAAATATENKNPNKPELKLPADKAEVAFPIKLEWTDKGDPDNGPQTVRNFSWLLKDSTGAEIWKRGWHTADTLDSQAECKGKITGFPNAWTCPSVTIPQEIQEKMKVGESYTWSVNAGDGKDDSGFVTPEFKFKVKASAAANTENQKPNFPELKLPADNAEVSFPIKLEWTDKGDLDAAPGAVRNFMWYMKDSKGVDVWSRGWNKEDTLDDQANCKKITTAKNAWTCPSVTIPKEIQDTMKVGETYSWSVSTGDGKDGSGFTKPEFKFKVKAAAAPADDTVAAPTHLAAVVTYNATKKGVDLTWDRMEGVDGYQLYRKLGTQTAPALADLADTAKGWIPLNPPSKTQIDQPSVATTKPAYFDNNPEKLTTDPLSYVVIAVKEIAAAAPAPATTKQSLPSNIVTTNPTATQTPQTITLAGVKGDKQVQLTWTDSNAAEKVGKYDIYRSTKSPVKIADPETKYVIGKENTVKTYTDSGLTNGTMYYYFIIASDPKDEFDVGISNEVTAKPEAPVNTLAQECDPKIIELKNKLATFNGSKTQANADAYNTLHGQLVTKGCTFPPDLPASVTAPAVVVTPPPAPGPSQKDIACAAGVQGLQNIFTSFSVNQTPELANLYNTSRKSLADQACVVNSSFPMTVAGKVAPPPVAWQPPPVLNNQPLDQPAPVEQAVASQQPQVITKVVYRDVPAQTMQPLQNNAVGQAQVLHPVSGNRPHNSAETGPEMWIYGVTAAASLWGSRRIAFRKKRKE